MKGKLITTCVAYGSKEVGNSNQLLSSNSCLLSPRNEPAISHFSFLISHFSFLISHFSFLICYLLFVICYLLFSDYPGFWGVKLRKLAKFLRHNEDEEREFTNVPKSQTKILSVLASIRRTSLNFAHLFEFAYLPTVIVRFEHGGSGNEQVRSGGGATGNCFLVDTTID